MNNIPITTSNELDKTKTLLSIFSNYADGLKICHFNAQSLIPKIDEFKYLFGSGNLDIICVSESWLRAHINNTLLKLPNYNIFRNDRVARIGGGVVIFTHHNLHARCIASSEPEAEVEFILLEIQIGIRRCLVGVAYKPPNATNLDDLRQILSEISHSYSDIIICGDFNTDLLNVCNTTCYFREIIESHGLSVVNSLPTHFTTTSSTLLDLFLTGNTDSVLFHNQISLPGFSRHDLIYLTYNLNVVYIEKRFTYRNFRSINTETLLSDVANIEWYRIYYMTSVEDQVAYMNSNINSLFHRHVPLRTRVIPNEACPWLTQRIINTISRRNHAYKRWKRFRTPETWSTYKMLRNSVTNAIRYNKAQYFNSKISSTLPSNKLWSNLKEMGIGRTKADNISEDANHLNNMFAAASACDRHTSREPDFSLSTGDGFSFNPFLQEDVVIAFSKVKSNCVGLDNIHPRFIKLIFPLILPFITHIFNNILTTCFFPAQWKYAKIIPVLKKSTPSCKEYRPISILPFLSKVFEKLLCFQITNFLASKSLLSDFQSGFVASRSCTSSLLKITEDIREAIVSDKLTVLTLLDFSKAFDKVDHLLIIRKLQTEFNFSKHSTKLISSYLLGRQQRVFCNDRFSNLLSTNSGVPQGSILGPLLFAMFINDLPHVVKHCKYHLYADDVQLYISQPLGLVEDCVYKLNEDLSSVFDWTQRNKLIINTSKSNAITIFKSKLDTSCFPNIVMNNSPIPYVDKVRNLGVIFNKVLSWATHIDSIVPKIYGILRQLSVSAQWLPLNTRLLLVGSL